MCDVGEDLEDAELVDLISESRNMKNVLSEYAGQKSNTITTARRLVEFLGSDMANTQGFVSLLTAHTYRAHHVHITHTSRTRHTHHTHITHAFRAHHTHTSCTHTTHTSHTHHTRNSIICCLVSY